MGLHKIAWRKLLFPRLLIACAVSAPLMPLAGAPALSLAADATASAPADLPPDSQTEANRDAAAGAPADEVSPSAVPPRIAPAPLDASPTTRPSFLGSGFRAGEGHRGGIAGRPFTAEESAAAIDFFHKNSPNRMQFFDRLPVDSRARARETSKLVELYRPLRNFKDSNPNLYELLVQQVQLRDQAFQLAREGNTDELHATVKKIVNVSLQAKHIRIDLLQRELDGQRSRLAAEEADPEAAAQKEMAQIRSTVDFLTGDHPFRRGLRGGNSFPGNSLPGNSLPANSLPGQSMLRFNPAIDPLANLAPLPAALVQPVDPAFPDASDDAATD